jgi:RNA polymerase sigma factor (sigma-70 family)
LVSAYKLIVTVTISSKEIRNQDKRNEKRAMSEEQKPSQRQVLELRDQRLLAGMEEDFDVGFDKVIEDYWRELYCWAYKLLEDSGFTYLSEDAVQEGLLSAYKDLRYHRQKLSNLHLQHWLYAIVRQKAIEYLKQGNKAARPAGLLGWENEEEDRVASRSADDDPASLLERWETVSEACRTVTELLTSLSDTQREVIVLRYFAQDGTGPEEIPYQQIAEKLNKPVGTVKSDVSRAMQHMRKRLTEQHGEDKRLQKIDLSMP